MLSLSLSLSVCQHEFPFISLCKIMKQCFIAHTNYSTHISLIFRERKKVYRKSFYIHTLILHMNRTSEGFRYYFQTSFHPPPPPPGVLCLTYLLFLLLLLWSKRKIWWWYIAVVQSTTEQQCKNVYIFFSWIEEDDGMLFPKLPRRVSFFLKNLEES